MKLLHFYNLLTEKIELNNTRTEITFSESKGTLLDGKPLTVEDVFFTMKLS